MTHKLHHAAVNWILAVVFGFFAYAHLYRFTDQPRLSSLLIVCVEAALVIFFLIRREPQQTLHSWATWLTTSGGTLFPLLLRPVAGAEDLIAGQVLQALGAAFQVTAILSLNRSMGLLPANRGVQTHGLYRFVRHPLYAAYTITLSGYLINNFGLYNVVIIVVGTALQILRIRYEERVLFGSSDYSAFALRTPWRLVPFVW